MRDHIGTLRYIEHSFCFTTQQQHTPSRPTSGTQCRTPTAMRAHTSMLKHNPQTWVAEVQIQPNQRPLSRKTGLKLCTVTSRAPCHRVKSQQWPTARQQTRMTPKHPSNTAVGCGGHKSRRLYSKLPTIHNSTLTLKSCSHSCKCQLVSCSLTQGAGKKQVLRPLGSAHQLLYKTCCSL